MNISLPLSQAASIPAMTIANQPLATQSASQPDGAGTEQDALRFLQALQCADAPPQATSQAAEQLGLLGALPGLGTEESSSQNTAERKDQNSADLQLAALLMPAMPLMFQSTEAEVAGQVAQQLADQVPRSAAMAQLNLFNLPSVQERLGAMQRPAAPISAAIETRPDVARVTSGRVDGALAITDLGKNATPASTAFNPEVAATREHSDRTTMVRTADAAAGITQTLRSDSLSFQAMPIHATSTTTNAPQTLLDVLGDHIALHLERGSERAVIRLDPHMQGQLEITIRRDAGVMQVQLHASNVDVVKQLQAISDSLRQDLSNRQHGEVVVVVSQGAVGARDGEGRGRQAAQTPEQEPGQALAEAENGQAPQRFALSSNSY
jgi:flagellar hook-length control protein FliK